METYGKYLKESMDAKRKTKEAKKLAKSFLLDLQIMSGKHRFDEIDELVDRKIDMMILKLSRLKDK